MFATEDQLINSFLRKSDTFLKSLLGRKISSYFVLNEFNSQFGIADIVLGTFRPQSSKERTGKSLNLNWLMPLASFKSGQKIELSEFQERYSLSRRSASSRIKAYEDAGYLHKVNDCTYEVAKEYQPITEFVVSIEAKLRDWKRASQQAQRYKRFSDFSFVLLDDSYSEPALKHLSKFKESNIGLITASKNKFKVHYVPMKNEMKYNEYYLRVNEAAFERMLESNQSC